jgi:hypothetical protein
MHSLLQDDARGVGYGALSGGNGDSDNDAIDDAYSGDEDTHSFGSFNSCSDAPQEQDPDVTAVSDSPPWGFEAPQELLEKQQPATAGKLRIIVHHLLQYCAVCVSCTAFGLCVRMQCLSFVCIAIFKAS